MADSTRVAAGHKANLNNPHTSVESKVHSKEVLKEEFGEDVPYKDGKHPGNVAGGLKAYAASPSWAITRAVLMKRQRYYQPERI